MRSRFILLFLLLCGFSAGHARVRGEFTLTGDLKPVVELWDTSLDSLRLVLMRGYNRLEPLELADGRFAFAGTVDTRYVETAYLRATAPGVVDFVLTIPVFLEPGAIRVRCRPLPEPEMFDLVVEGTPSNDQLSARVSRTLDATYELLAVGRDTTLADAEKTPLIERLYRERDSLYTHLYRDLSDSPIAPMLAVRQFYGTNRFDEAARELARLRERFPGHPDLHDLESTWQSMPGLGVENTVPDFAAVDREGRPVRFSEIAGGGYVLLDFWFTAHGGEAPPRFPTLYNGLPLRRVGLSTDPSRAVWLRSLRRREPPGLQLWDEGHAISSAFHVTAYPVRFLIDPQGKIVAKGDFTTLPEVNPDN